MASRTSRNLSRGSTTGSRQSAPTLTLLPSRRSHSQLGNLPPPRKGTHLDPAEDVISTSSSVESGSTGTRTRAYSGASAAAPDIALHCHARAPKCAGYRTRGNLK